MRLFPVLGVLAIGCATPRPPDSERTILTLDADEQGPCKEQRWVEEDGTVVWAPEGVNDAPVVLFLHERGGAPADHDSAQRLLARRGYAVVVPPLPEEAPDLAAWASEALARHLSRTVTGVGDPRRVAAVGYGAGGSVALEMAAQPESALAAAVGWAPTGAPAEVGRPALVLTATGAEPPAGVSRVEVLEGTRAGFLDVLPEGAEAPADHFGQLRRARQLTVAFLDAAWPDRPPAAACRH